MKDEKVASYFWAKEMAKVRAYLEVIRKISGKEDPFGYRPCPFLFDEGIINFRAHGSAE